MRHGDKRILVVDDDPGVATFLEMVLRESGYKEVTVLNKGTDVLACLQSDRADGSPPSPQDIAYDAILLDVMLPKMNGFELCRQIRDQWGKKPVIILISGYEFADKAPRYIDSGADDFLNKPLKAEELLHRLDVQFIRRTHYSESIATGRQRDVPANCNMDHIGAYQIHRALSWSGAFVVYEADHNGIPCMVKILTQQAMECDDIKERFFREERIMGSLKHPNIVAFIDKGEYQNLAYFVTEQIDAPSLDIYCQTHPDLDFPTIIHIARQMTDAIDCMHQHGIIHRDIKMKNVFINDEERVKIGDFGISYVEGYPRLTQPGFALGTPAYMAPEQFSGGDITPALDIYSFGATLYHLSTGSPPYSASNAMEFMRKHLNERPPPITLSRPGFPKNWDRFIIDECMAVNPQNRPDSMKDVIHRLAEFTPA